MRKTYDTLFTNEENEMFNKILNIDTRKKAMSVYQYIIKYQDKTIGFLEMSLDRLHKKFSRYHVKMSVAYFKKIANSLVERGLLKVRRKGRLKFYGSKSQYEKNHKEENEKLKEENKNLIKELEKLKEEKDHKDFTEKAGELEVKEHKINKILVKETLVEADRDYVIDAACKLMKEVKMKNGSTPYMQVIESLHFAMDKKPIHIAGMMKYIKKTIEEKIHKQSLFKNKLIKSRKVNVNNFNNFNNFISSNYDYEALERKLLGWD